MPEWIRHLQHLSPGCWLHPWAGLCQHPPGANRKAQPAGWVGEGLGHAEPRGFAFLDGSEQGRGIRKRQQGAEPRQGWSWVLPAGCGRTPGTVGGSAPGGVPGVQWWGWAVPGHVVAPESCSTPTPSSGASSVA